MEYRFFQVSEGLWQEVLDRSPCATFYHTPAWTTILSQTFPKWQNAAWGIEFEDGNRAIFPMLKRSLIGRIPYYWYESTVPGAYGGPIFQSPAGSVHYEIINRELSKFSNVMVVGNPFSDWRPGDHFIKKEAFIQTLDLKTGFPTIWKNYSKGRRHTINYAKKQGVVVQETDFLEHYPMYYQIYQVQLKRWGRSATDYYPLRLFKNLADYAKGNPVIKLWAAWLDHKMVSGLIVFYHRKHLVTWHGATLDEYFSYRPVDLLYSAVIEAACQAGYEVFDFANSGGHDNVVRYKERFGAAILPLTIYRRKNIGGSFYRAGRVLHNYLGRCPED